MTGGQTNFTGTLRCDLLDVILNILEMMVDTLIYGSYFIFSLVMFVRKNNI